VCVSVCVLGEVVLRDRVTAASMSVWARLCFVWSCVCFV